MIVPSYLYEALDGEGQMIRGRVEADSESAASERVTRMGYMPMELSEARDFSLLSSISFEKKVSMGELSLFTRQLASMINAGIPLIGALYALSEQSSNPKLADVIDEIGGDVESGANLSEAMRGHPEVFSSMYADMIKAGEVGGNLVDVLQRLAEQLEKDKALRDNLKSATMYPIGVIAFAFTILMLMMFFIVPIFVDMFPDGVLLPVPTRIIVGFSDSLRRWWYLYFAGMFAIGMGIKMYFSSESGRRVWDRVKFALPVFGPLFQKTTVARFCRTLATLLGGGIAILEALDTAGPTSGSIQVEKTVNRAAQRIQEGESLAKPLSRSRVFPPMVTMMISIGEETGELPNLLNRIAEFYESEVESITRGLTSLIEPILIVVVGGLVALMVIALYLPLFTVITQIS